MQAGDRLHMAASHAEINDFFKTLGHKKAQTKIRRGSDLRRRTGQLLSGDTALQHGDAGEDH